MDDLETLRPEVADAVSALDETTCMTNPGLKWYATIRAELLRLATIEADALIALDCEHDWQVEHKRAEKAEAELAEAQNTIAAQQGTMGALKRKLALSKGKLAALKARIECADAGIVYRCADCKAAHVSPVEDMLGKRVALVLREE